MGTSRQFLTALAFAILFCAGQATGDVLTQRYNQERTGSVLQPGLDQRTVKDPRWGLLGTLSVQGTVYAQPLVVEGIGFPGTPNRRDIVFVATAQNQVYAFDAHTFAPIWSNGPNGIHLGDNDKSKIGHPGCDGISGPEGIGVEATPVIDRARGVVFVSYRVNHSRSDASKAEQWLRAIDLRTGATIQDVRLLPPNAPADWTVWHRSRAGLLLLNGVIYVSFASRCEDPGTPIFHGWILAYDAATLRSAGSFETTADSAPGHTIDGGGIWQGAVGLAADADGNIYATTGNRRGPPDDNSSWDTQNLADSSRPRSREGKMTPSITLIYAWQIGLRRTARSG